MNQGWVYREQVDRTGAGQTVLDYYCDRYSHSTRDQWRDRILSAQIHLGDRPTHPDILLTTGQSLAYHRPPWQEADVPLTFSIIHDDQDLLVINKPSGLPVLPGGNFLEHTLLHLLRQQYPEQIPYPLHRLGRGTSGILLLAKTAQARSQLSQQIRDHKLLKIYRALIGACDLPYTFPIDHPIGKHPHPRLRYTYGITPSGKPAHSEVRILKRNLDSTLLEVRILTGRPHQIRIHLAAIGYPLLGDPLYQAGGIASINTPDPAPSASIPVPSDCGYHLHAALLSFHHPRTQRSQTFTCQPPSPLS